MGDIRFKVGKAMEHEKAACEELFYSFYKKAFEVLEPGTDYIDNWHVEYLCWIVQREFMRIQAKRPAKWKDIIINVPPRTSKSLIFSVVFPVWAWIKDPTFRMITASYSKELSESFSFQSLSLMRSNWFKAHWGDLFSIDKGSGGKESVGHTINDKQGRRKTSSTMSNLTGYGGMMVFIDDPVNPVQAASEAKTKEANNWYDQTLPSRLNNRNVGVFFTIMQRLSENDPTQHLINKGGRYLHIKLPAIQDGTELMPGIKMLPHLKPYPGGLLFPGILGREVLEDMQKTESGKLEFATQYQQRPSPEGGLHMKKEHLRVISKDDFERKYGNNIKHWQFYADTSMGDSKRSDPTGVGACCQIGKDLFIRKIDAKRVRSENLPEYLEEWAKLNGYRKGVSSMLIEPKSSGPTVTGMLTKKKALNAHKFTFPAGNAVNINSGKIEKFKSIVPIVASGREDGGVIYFIEGEWFDAFQEQVTVFPNSANDDMADVLVMMATDFYYDRIGRFSYSDSAIKIHN